MKFIKAIISLTMLLTVLLISGCGSQADFTGTWYGISNDRIIKAEIEKREDGYYVKTSYGQYELLQPTKTTLKMYWTGIGKNNMYTHNPTKAEVKDNILHFVGATDAYNWTMTKDGNIVGRIDLFTMSDGHGTLEREDKVKLEVLKKAIQEPTKQNTDPKMNYIFTDEQPKEWKYPNK